jgi:hypothetical protein
MKGDVMILHLCERAICEFYVIESSSWQLTIITQPEIKCRSIVNGLTFRFLLLNYQFFSNSYILITSLLFLFLEWV